MDFSPALKASGADTLMQIKVVPGASRTKIVGMLGERIKVAVSAPPQDGKANQAVCALLAESMGISKKRIEVDAGDTQPHKTLRVMGMNLMQVQSKLEK